MGCERSVWLFTKTPVPEMVMVAYAEKAKQFIKHTGTLHNITKQKLRQALLPWAIEPRNEEHSNVTYMWQIAGQIKTISVIALLS